jgi:hypothetical protein
MSEDSCELMYLCLSSSCLCSSDRFLLTNSKLAMLFMTSAALFGFSFPSSDITSARVVASNFESAMAIDSTEYFLTREHRRYGRWVGARDGLRDLFDVFWNLNPLQRRFQLQVLVFPRLSHLQDEPSLCLELLPFSYKLLSLLIQLLQELLNSLRGGARHPFEILRRIEHLQRLVLDVSVHVRYLGEQERDVTSPVFYRPHTETLKSLKFESEVTVHQDGETQEKNYRERLHERREFFLFLLYFCQRRSSQQIFLRRVGELLIKKGHTALEQRSENFTDTTPRPLKSSADTARIPFILRGTTPFLSRVIQRVRRLDSRTCGLEVSEDDFFNRVNFYLVVGSFIDQTWVIALKGTLKLWRLSQHIEIQFDLARSAS